MCECTQQRIWARTSSKFICSETRTTKLKLNSDRKYAASKDDGLFFIVPTLCIQNSKNHIAPKQNQVNNSSNVILE